MKQRKENVEYVEYKNKMIVYVRSIMNNLFIKKGYMDKNTNALFGELNQADAEKQRMACTIFAVISAVKYNSGLQLSEKDADIIINNQITKKQLSITEGAKIMDSIEAVKKYMKNIYDKKLKFIQFKKTDTNKLQELLDLGYMITIGISVDKDFVNDVKDGKIDETNYFNFKNGKTYGHFTNIARWKGRFTPGYETLEDYNKDFIFDSYAFHKSGRAWMYYNIDFKQLPLISQDNYFCFYF